MKAVEKMYDNCYISKTKKCLFISYFQLNIQCISHVNLKIEINPNTKIRVLRYFYLFRLIQFMVIQICTFNLIYALCSQEIMPLSLGTNLHFFHFVLIRTLIRPYLCLWVNEFSLYLLLLLD